MLFDFLRTSNAAIKKVHLNCNQALNEKSMRALGEYVQNNTSIEDIDASGCNIADEHLEILAPYMEGNTTLKRLILNWSTRITDKSVPYLVRMLEKSHISVLGIEGTSIVKSIDLFIPLACNATQYGSGNFDFQCG